MSGTARVGITLVLLSALCATASAEQARHALLIGIQDYAGDKLKPLRGPRNDIGLVKELLQRRFGVPVSNITTLLDREATPTGVGRAFAGLARRVAPGDFVYIHYAGHGSQTKDLNGDERSGQDQTWVTYGARAGRYQGIDDREVLDDQINAWLKPILAKTEDLIFVSDSCHSASVTRGPIKGVRALPADPRPHPLGRQTFDTWDDSRGVRIGAARDRETAIEIQADDGLDYGLFTWYWVQALDQTLPGETWDDAFKRAYTLVSTHEGAHQRPQLEGAGDRLIFGGRFAQRSPTVAVRNLGSEGKVVTIDVGSANGASGGSLYRRFDPQEPNQEALPTLELKRVAAFTSEGEVRQGHFQRGDLVVETAHAYPFDPIPICLEADFSDSQDRQLVGRLSDSLKDLDGFNVVGDRGKADWILYILRPKRRNGELIYAGAADTLPKSFEDADPEVWVISGTEALLHERMRIPLDDPDAGIDALRENLTKFARIREIKRLDPRMGNLDVQLQFYLLRPDPACDTDCIELSGPEGNKQAYRKQGPLDSAQIATRGPRLGDVLGFAVRNGERKDYYAYLINIAPGGEVQPIFPGPYDSMDYARVDAGETRDLTRRVGLMFNEAGEEYIKLIVTSRPIDVRVFQSTGYLSGVRSTRLLDPLERLLAEALHTRGQKVLFSDREWDTREAVFEVGP